MFDFFKKNKKQKKEKYIYSQKIHDIKIAPHKSIILFKDKEWKIEITRQSLLNFLYKFKFLISGFIIFLIFILVFNFYFKTKAEIVKFYPESCLGGWQNSQNASGKPNLGQNANYEDFNELNSAVLKNIISEIYCGNFKGDIPENSKPQKAILKFSWLILEGEKNNQNSLSGGVENIETSTLIRVEYLSTSSDEIISTTTDTTTEQIINKDTLLEKENQNTNSDSILNQESNLNENNVSSQNNNILPNQKIEQIPEIIPEQTIEQISPSSFWNKLFNFVFAQSLENNLENQTSSTNLQNLNTKTKSTPESLNQEFSTITKTTTQTSTLNNITFSSNNENKQLQFLEKDNIFEISYTFDGINWNSLGEVGFYNWKNLELEIPDFNWSKLENFQVKIQSISPKEYNFIAYLDGMILEVEYQIGDYYINNYDCIELNNKFKLLNNLNLNQDINENLDNNIFLDFYDKLEEGIFVYNFKIKNNSEFWIENKDINICRKFENFDLNQKIGFYNNILFFIDKNNVLNGIDLISNNSFSTIFEENNYFLINEKKVKILKDKYLKFQELD